MRLDRKEAIQTLYLLIYEKIEQYDQDLQKYSVLEDLENKNRSSRNLDIMYQVKRYLEDNLK